MNCYRLHILTGNLYLGPSRRGSYCFNDPYSSYNSFNFYRLHISGIVLFGNIVQIDLALSIV